jgi:predicted lipid-binding transport protein (Tim44 family)
MITSKSRRSRLALALVAGLALVATGADARPGGGSSSGSRGSRTYSAPPSTSTAPSAAQPMQRTEAPRMGPTSPGPSYGAPAQPRRFGFGGGLMAGLLGAGLLGMLMGHGFFGGLAGLASVFGLLLQVALIGGLIWLGLRLLRRRHEPAYAGAGAPYARSALGDGDRPNGGGGAARPRPAERSDTIGIGPADYAAFEHALSEVQAAYGREDVAVLGQLATPEMARYFEQDLAENARRGLVNRIGRVRLESGDLAEAWREGRSDYATVAMRFSLTDAMVDRATGRVVSGDPDQPTQATELWTFRRDAGGPWRLSAIQQTA